MILQAIYDMFKGFIEIVHSVVDFVVKLFTDLVAVVRLLAQTVANLPRMLGFLPSTVLAVVLATFGVVVIYKVLGREG